MDVENRKRTSSIKPRTQIHSTVLVMNSIELHRLEFWLKFMETFGRSIMVIVVREIKFSTFWGDANAHFRVNESIQGVALTIWWISRRITLQAKQFLRRRTPEPMKLLPGLMKVKLLCLAKWCTGPPSLLMRARKSPQTVSNGLLMMSLGLFV